MIFCQKFCVNKKSYLCSEHIIFVFNTMSTYQPIKLFLLSKIFHLQLVIHFEERSWVSVAPCDIATRHSCWASAFAPLQFDLRFRNTEHGVDQCHVSLAPCCTFLASAANIHFRRSFQTKQSREQTETKIGKRGQKRKKRKKKWKKEQKFIRMNEPIFYVLLSIVLDWSQENFSQIANRRNKEYRGQTCGAMCSSRPSPEDCRLAPVRRTASWKYREW